MDLIGMIGIRSVLWCLTSVKMMGVVYSQLTPDNTEGGEFCFLDRFEANCTGRGFILLINAQFGRMRAGDCIQDSDLQLGCQANVINYMDRQCSGRETCGFPVTHLSTISTTGCKQDLFPYLDARYFCADALLGNQGSCDIDETTYLTGKVGYISSRTLESRFFGTIECTFTITVLPGQTVDFDIFDFTLKDSVGVSSTGTDPFCPVEATFMEHREPTTRQLCNGSLRQRYLYSSKSNLVVVYFTLNDQITNVPWFFLKYQASGCAHYQAPVNTSVEMEDVYATVTCNFTGDVWTYECRGTTWVLQEGNTVENCTREIAAERNKTDAKEDEGFPWVNGTIKTKGILIAVGIGIALGTVVGLSLLGLVFLCKKCCCPDKREPLRPQDSIRNQIARDVPAMDDIISEASLLAKQVPPVRSQPSLHYAPQQFGPMSQTVAASIEYNPAGPQHFSMMNVDMRNRSAATLPRPRSVDSMSDHIYEAYKYRGGESGSMISESSSAEQLQTLGASSLATAAMPLRVAPPVAPKPSVPARQASISVSEASTSTSHPVASEETVTDKL